MSGVGVGVGIGAGIGVSSVALAPFNAANTFMGSAFFGYGMILGERYAYQADWPKIQARLENGEKIENIIQEYTGRFTAVVMKEAKIIFESVTEEFVNIMANAIKNALDPKFTLPVDPPTIGDPRRQPFKPPTTVPKPKPFDPTNPVIPPIQPPTSRPPRQKPTPPPRGPRVITNSFALQNATSWVEQYRNISRLMRRKSKNTLAMKLVKQGTYAEMKNWLRLSYPSNLYNEYKFNYSLGNLLSRDYKISKSKI